jgi:hypothetical protein
VAKKQSLNGSVPQPLVEARTKVLADPATHERWPKLLSCLLPHWDGDKCTRQAGSLRVRLVGGYYLVTLSCPTEGLDTTVTVDSLTVAWDQLEEALANGRAVWLPDWSTTKKARQAKV